MALITLDALPKKERIEVVLVDEAMRKVDIITTYRGYKGRDVIDAIVVLRDVAINTWDGTYFETEEEYANYKAVFNDWGYDPPAFS